MPARRAAQLQGVLEESDDQRKRRHHDEVHQRQDDARLDIRDLPRDRSPRFQGCPKSLRLNRQDENPRVGPDRALGPRLHVPLASCPTRFMTHSMMPDRKSTRLNSSHSQISYAVFCLKKKKNGVIDFVTMYLTDVINP